jgi:hypothetical protein
MFLLLNFLNFTSKKLIIKTFINHFMAELIAMTIIKFVAKSQCSYYYYEDLHWD